MYKIFKYQVGPRLNKLMLPRGSRVLTVQAQMSHIYAWVQFPVDCEETLEECLLLITFTGVEFNMPDNFEYLCTTQTKEMLVCHCYIEKPVV